MRYHGFVMAFIVAFSFTVLASQPAVAESSGEPVSVKVRLDWRPGSQHAPFYVGKALGFYEEEGIALDVISGSGSTDTVIQVGSNAVEFGVADALVLVQAAAQQVPTVSISAYYQRTPIVLLSPEERPVTSPQQLLEGVVVGNKKGSATSQGLSAMLAANGIAETDVSLRDIGFGVQPLLVGQVDALMGFAMNEPVEAATAGMPVHVMPISDHGVEAYGLTLVTSSRLIEESPDLVAGFLRATLRAIDATIEDPKAAVDAVTAAVEESEAEREEKVLELTIPYWKPDPSDGTAPGVQSAERWQETIDVAVELGLVDTAMPASVIFTNQFLAQ